MAQKLIDLVLQDGRLIEQTFGARQRLPRGIVVLTRLLIQFHDIIGDDARTVRGLLRVF